MYEERQNQCRELEVCCKWEARVVQGSRDIELDRYRAVEAERSKWEAREERLVRQLEQLEERSEYRVTEGESEW